MPQLKAGQVTPGQNGAPKLYGVDKVENTIPFQERLLRRFKPQDYVQIKNIDDQPVYWQYLPDDAERESFSEDGMQKIITRDTPQMWVIEPGQVEPIIGASAYRALDVMYKQVSAKKTLRQAGITASFNKEGQHIPQNFNFADGGAQEAFIEQAYLGKVTPTFGDFKPEDDFRTTIAEVENQATEAAKRVTNGTSKA